MAKPTVSIIIVSFNTKALLMSCIESVKKYADVPCEIIVSDNGSTDGSLESLRKTKGIILLENNSNLGFAKGNNAAKKYANGEYVLFLNPDTVLQKGAISKTLKFLKEHKKVGAVSCKVVLANGEFDKDTRRSFPTPFIALTHFSGMDRVFPTSLLFARYWYGNLSEETEHGVDCIQGAFFLTPRRILDKVLWFDEDYFLDGEDIDLCWKIRKAGLEIMYYPEATITHFKKGSKKANRSLRSVVGGVNAMELFYKKRLWSEYPVLVNVLVLMGINILKVIRIVKFKIMT